MELVTVHLENGLINRERYLQSLTFLGLFIHSGPVIRRKMLAGQRGPREGRITDLAGKELNHLLKLRYPAAGKRGLSVIF